MSNDARCRVFGKILNYPDVHDKQRYDLSVLLDRCRAQPWQLMESQRCIINFFALLELHYVSANCLNLRDTY